ncbi:redoxin domain-containing protein [candidate division KSB1 bacterium]|nr:redoxin domain-containing protein [candidate division KSB1 bacterium]
MKLKNVFLFVLIITLISSSLGFSQVLGSCGSQDENEPAKVTSSDVQSVLRPGDKAVNFSLPAVVGDEIKTVKLSDYNGMWRVVCFYPADFTFV